MAMRGILCGMSGSGTAGMSGEGYPASRERAADRGDRLSCAAASAWQHCIHGSMHVNGCTGEGDAGSSRLPRPAPSVRYPSPATSWT